MSHDPQALSAMPTIVIVLTLAALLLNVAAFALSLLHKEANARCMLVAAWGMAGALFAANWSMADAPPFGNMRHVLCFFSLTLAPACLLLRRRHGLRLTGYFAATAALSLAGALCMPLQAAWRQMPALQSPWFAPHVTSYVIAYGLLAVSAFLALRSFSRRRAVCMHAADAVAKLAFPFLTFGLWSGAIWADAAWARYWAWDIKEVWSLLSWLIYLIYFHAERCASLARLRRPLLLAGFCAILVTFFVVNLLPRIESIHSYATN